MSTEQENMAPTPQKKDRTGLFIGFVVLLLAVIAFFYYQTENLKAEKELQAKELSTTILQLDSISQELSTRIATIEELGGEIDTLVQIKAQLEADKKNLLTRQNNQQEMIASLKDRVDGYQELLLAKDEEIEQLKVINEALLTENVVLKNTQEELKETVKEINKAKDELAEKVAFAARLKVESIRVFGLSEGGREREGEFRSRHAEQLKITFTVLENKVAPIEGKQLMLRIVAPDGNVLFDVTRGSGSFIFEGREMFYTAKQEILYDKSNQLVTVFYTKGSEYVLGQYQVEIYTDDYLMGTGTFLVK